ncbi:MAG: ABC transporter ATP-binding protein [Anaerolineae bacterium]|nr:ABC transporter ATP-binding protein [Anaerolineae bacterium]
MPTPLLQVKDLTKVYSSGLIRKTANLALDRFNMSLFVERPKIVAIAGESGSGKTTLARLILGFLTPTSGQAIFQGQDIWHMSKEEWLGYRQRVQAIYQDPYEVYNPFYKVDHVLNMVIGTFHLTRNRDERRKIQEDALEIVGLRPTEVLGKYPHQLSGGQRQRVMVARAFMLRPQLIVADEPVSMIDASLRGMVLDIMLRLKQERGISFLYITHDLSTAYQISDEIFVLYRGSIAESGDIGKVINSPQHPYTQTLLASIPVPDPDVKWAEHLELLTTQELLATTRGACKFYDRCRLHYDRCQQSEPELFELEENHFVACHFRRREMEMA